VGLFFSHSSTADLTCPSQVVSDEVCITLLERVGNLTIRLLLVYIGDIVATLVYSSS
jgi:hypothetical protein